MIVATNLCSIQQALAHQFESVALKGQGLSSFLLVSNQGRGIEVSEHEGQYRIEFWEKSNGIDASPVMEMTVANSEQAVREIQRWLV